MKYILLLCSVSLAVIGQLFLKNGINRTSLELNPLSILKTIFTPYVFFGFVFYGVSSIVWLFILKKFPLSIAYPALSLSYILVVIFSVYFFKEPLTINKLIVISLIFLGVVVLFK